MYVCVCACACASACVCVCGLLLNQVFYKKTTGQAMVNTNLVSSSFVFCSIFLFL